MSPAIVLHPPIDRAEYATTPGSAITLVNLTEPKGASLFFELARRMPEHHFLGVRGWGPQSTPPDLPNLRVVGPLDDMREAYSQTRVLLMPSAYESYGRVALEAAASGIPSIACRVGGLVEALGDAGIWADRADPDAWVTAISQLDDERSWKERSELAQGRFDELDPALEISHLETALLRIVSTGAV